MLAAPELVGGSERLYPAGPGFKSGPFFCLCGGCSSTTTIDLLHTVGIIPIYSDNTPLTNSLTEIKSYVNKSILYRLTFIVIY